MRYFLCLASIVLINFSSCKSSIVETADYKSLQAINADSTVNMIVEIPAGTTAKYEMNKGTYSLEMDSIDGRPRYIDYLGYPGNYGMIPNTISLKKDGGDGDPLDILLLGAATPRGSVQKVTVIGVLELLDNGEQDDKLIAIDPATHWAKVTDIDDLDIYYPGAKAIVATFFQNYKGKGQMKLQGWSGQSRAMQILHESISEQTQ